MQQAMVRYATRDASKGKEGVSVDLVSVIHIGDREFYQGLNKRFEGYDVVLWEGVKGQPKSKLLLVVAAALAPLIDHDPPRNSWNWIAESGHRLHRQELRPRRRHLGRMGERVTKKGHTRLSVTWGVTVDVAKMMFGPSEPAAKTRSSARSRWLVLREEPG